MMLARHSKVAVTVASRTSASLRLLSTATIDDRENTLYQYAICPFCNIVRSVLDFTQTPYKAVEVNPLNKKEIKWSKEYNKVPIANLKGDVIYGSCEIVEGLLSKNTSGDLSWPPSEATEKWTNYAKDDLAPLLYPNLCNTIPNSFQAFGYVHDVNTFSMVERISIQSLGSIAMYFAASKIKKKRGIDDEKQALREALVLLEDELKDGQPFLNASSTTEPDLGDLFVFGVLRGLEGLEVYDEVMSEFDSISRWYNSMDEIVKKQ